MELYFYRNEAGMMRVSKYIRVINKKYKCVLVFLNISHVYRIEGSFFDKDP